MTSKLFYYSDYIIVTQFTKNVERNAYILKTLTTLYTIDVVR